MKKESENIGCLKLVLYLTLIYVALYVFNSLDYLILSLLGSPFVYIGLPIAILIVAYYSSKK